MKNNKQGNASEPQNTQKLNNDKGEHSKSGQQRFKAAEYKNKENSFDPEKQPGGKSGRNQGHGPADKSKGQHGGNR